MKTYYQNPANENMLQKEKRYLERMAQKCGMEFENQRSMMLAYGTVFSEEIMIVEFEGKEYFRFMLECFRKSQTSDIIPVMVKVSPKTQSLKFVKQGTALTMLGTFRSSDWTEEDGNHHLDVFFEAQHFEFSDNIVERGFDKNIVILTGYICTEPTVKVTKNNITIAEYRVAVDNKDGVPEYFPIIAWGKKAVEVYSEYHCGDKIRILGRLQSRVYHKKVTDENLVAYEVSSRFTRRLETKKRNKNMNMNKLADSGSAQ